MKYINEILETDKKWCQCKWGILESKSGACRMIANVDNVTTSMIKRLHQIIDKRSTYIIAISQSGNLTIVITFNKTTTTKCNNEN